MAWLCGCLLLVGGCRQVEPVSVPHLLAGRTMGTTYSIKIVPQPNMPELVDVSASVEAELLSVNRQMSTYDEASELSQFNLYEKSDWFPVSSETVTVVQLSNELSKKTGGSFDVTVGPLVNLWGFGPAPRPRSRPSQTEISEALSNVGYEMLEFRTSPPALRKLAPQLYVDLSAVAKGHGVDRVADVLDSLGLKNYFIEIGGEVRTKGMRHDGQPWRVGVELPDSERRDILRVVELSDQSLATSGNYRNFYEVDGQRFAHTISPETGYPLQTDVVSASVIAERCSLADGIATAMMCTTAEEGLALANANNWAVLLVVSTGDSLKTFASQKFTEFVPDTSEVLEGELQ